MAKRAQAGQPGPDPDEAQVVEGFDRLFRERRPAETSTWRGVPARKSPFDLWVYQEILHRTRPQVIVETGTGEGGSAYYLASICDLIGAGRVITIGDRLEGRPGHPRITYLTGSPLASEIVSEVSESIEPGEHAMVILGSSTSRDQVLGELRTYSPLVAEGDYVIVEGTTPGAHPGSDAGAMEAVQEFLAECEQFVADPECEKFFVSFNRGGYLRRASDQRRQ